VTNPAISRRFWQAAGSIDRWESCDEAGDQPSVLAGRRLDRPLGVL